MADLNGYDATQHDPTNPFDPVPAGTYTVAITASEMKPTQAGDGKFLKLEFTIIDGEYRGRKVWDRLNLSNPNQTAVSIAQSTLSAICHAVNVLQPRDSLELHNLPLTARVTVKRREDTGDLTNEVKAYAKKGTTMAAPTEASAPAQAPQAPQTAQAAKNVPPWQR